jgi:hypothetical protein
MPDQLAVLAANREVNTVLQALLTGAQAVLGEHFIGLYLYGSLASGDFNPQSSDIDSSLLPITICQKNGSMISKDCISACGTAV